MRPGLKNAVLALVALMVLLLALELVLRTTHAFNARLSWIEPDTLIGWRFTPEREYWYHAENDHPITGRINSHGWRDVERALEPSAGVFRVAVIGDSFVEAFQVELDSTFTAICERELRAAGRDVEVMNFGRSGMTQAEELLVLRRDVARFRPDLVVAAFVPSNDIADLNPATTVNPARPFFADRDGALALDTSFNRSRGFRLKRSINPLKQRSALVSLATERYNVLRQARRQKAVGQGAAASAMPPELTLCTSSPDSVYLESYHLARRLFAGMARAAGGPGQLVILSIDVEHRPERLRELMAADPTFNPAFFEMDLAAWGARRAIPVVGLQGPFASFAQRTGRSLRWAHWNYEGHRVVAEELGAMIERRMDAMVRPLTTQPDVEE